MAANTAHVSQPVRDWADEKKYQIGRQVHTKDGVRGVIVEFDEIKHLIKLNVKPHPGEGAPVVPRWVSPDELR